MGVPGLLSFLIQRLKHEEKRREALGEKGETNPLSCLAQTHACIPLS